MDILILAAAELLSESSNLIKCQLHWTVLSQDSNISAQVLLVWISKKVWTSESYIWEVSFITFQKWIGKHVFRQERRNCGHMRVSKLYIEEVMNICVSFYQCSVFSLGSLSLTSFAIWDETLIGDGPSSSAAASRLSRVPSLSCVFCFLTSCEEPLPQLDGDSCAPCDMIICFFFSPSQKEKENVPNVQLHFKGRERWAELWQNICHCLT